VHIVKHYEQRGQVSHTSVPGGRVLIIGEEPLTPVFPTTVMPQVQAIDEWDAMAAKLVDHLDADDTAHGWSLPSPDEVAPRDPRPAA
jgi:hypothetical protein